MRASEAATKAHARCGYCKHPRKFGKRLGNKAIRKAGKINLLDDAS